MEIDGSNQVVVLLSGSEVMHAAMAGVMRRWSALSKGRNGVYGADVRAAWDHDINGALAEYAVAKWLGAFWSPTIGRIDQADVRQFQVRSKLLKTDRLVVRPCDKDTDIFISVLVETPKYTLCGWLEGGEAKCDKWVVAIDRPPMYFVPDKFLRPMARLNK